VTRIVLALVSKETRETVERWQFDIHTTAEQPPQEAAPQAAVPSAADQQVPFEPVARSDHDMQAEALQIFRQIFSSVTFMPALEPDQCMSFTQNPSGSNDHLGPGSVLLTLSPLHSHVSF
jgi:mitotic spindle assembly checkpoint protein MAD2